MAKPQAKIGDIVQLASGGPQMTVIAIKGGQTECSWFDNEQKQRRAQFPQKALLPVAGEKLSDEQLIAIAQRGLRKSTKKNQNANMKKSIVPAVLVVLLALSPKAPAQTSQYVTLVMTNAGFGVQIPVQPNQMVSVVGYDWTDLPDIYGKTTNGFGNISLTPYHNSLGLGPSTSPGLAQMPQIVTGLTNIGVSSAAVGWATFQITTPSSGNVVTNYVPADAIVIPTSATGNVQIILESSADLANWTAANPGTYSGSFATNRFFRVRAAVRN